ncbi:Scr1 family TA system antitoxin-like transcriptional regulator [Streptomyces sp. NPDC048157]|uniref:Scr1 family TA system antitoxin-like transcriptional regulator n=1 Tax=Streptomyces sp. NPDC048157 TaxID=3365503 RepID=UPI00371B0915
MGAFSILGYSAHADLPVGHTELLTSALYVEERTAVAAYRDAVQQLRAAALSVDESR